MAQKQESYFWTSYSDLMTSLFFVMLVLFVLACAMLNNKANEAKNEANKAERLKEATEKEMEKIREIEESIAAIDPQYFEYSAEHKKHILKIKVQFANNSYEIPQSSRDSLIAAGRSIADFLQKKSSDDIKYLLVIEGQASSDDYWGNDELSYNRANALRYLWKKNGINFDHNDKCELIVAGSGKEGAGRSRNKEEENRRFLIHIIPKPGIIDRIENAQQ